LLVQLVNIAEVTASKIEKTTRPEIANLEFPLVSLDILYLRLQIFRLDIYRNLTNNYTTQSTKIL